MGHMKRGGDRTATRVQDSNRLCAIVRSAAALPVPSSGTHGPSDILKQSMLEMKGKILYFAAEMYVIGGASRPVSSVLTFPVIQRFLLAPFFTSPCC